MLAVGVKVAVQVRPPSVVLKSPMLPFSTVTSLLSKPVTCSLKVTVTVEVSPILSAVSLSVILVTMGAVASMAMLLVDFEERLPAASMV